MNSPCPNNTELGPSLKRLWGASEMPFYSSSARPFVYPDYEQTLQRLKQLIQLKAAGILHGPNGIGKSYLINQLVKTLPSKPYKAIVVTHSTLRGNGLLRQLSLRFGKTPRMRREDNLEHLQTSWRELKPTWPILLLEEAQNLSADALEEVRLLSLCEPNTQMPFTLLFIGDENLMPRLLMGVNHALLNRLSFCLSLQPLQPEQSRDYIQARLAEVSITQNPFEPASLELIVQAAQGLPRLINHICQRAFEIACRVESPRIDPPHIREALDQMPWLIQPPLNPNPLPGG